jgi:hypothetical protein
MASAWVRTVFGKLRFERLRALVHPENVASIRVLAKLRIREERRELPSQGFQGVGSVICRDLTSNYGSSRSRA